MSTFLTEDEISALTGRLRSDAQVRVLRFMCIEHRIRPDGKVVVLRAHVDSVMGGTPKTSHPKKKEYALDLAAIK